MDFSKTDQQEALIAEIRGMEADLQNGSVRERDERSDFSREIWDLCGEHKLQGMPIPVEYGGRGFDAITTVIGLDSLGYVCHDAGLCFSLAAHLLACTVPVWKFGSEELKQKYLPKLCNGQLICANSTSEASAGSDVNHMKTTAEEDGSSYTINGSKTFITNAPVADVSLVYAMTNKEKGYFGGMSAFLVETGTKGLDTNRPIRKLGLCTSPMGEQYFDKLKVPASQMVGKPGAGGPMFAHSMDWERICLGAIHVGAMQRILEQSIAYAKEQEKTGNKTETGQSVTHLIAEMRIALETARLITYQTAWKMNKTRIIAMDAAMSKLFVSEQLNKVAEGALTIMGRSGFNKDSDPERYLRDSVSARIYSGTSEIQKNIIAKWLGL